MNSTLIDERYIFHLVLTSITLSYYIIVLRWMSFISTYLRFLIILTYSYFLNVLASHFILVHIYIVGPRLQKKMSICNKALKMLGFIRKMFAKLHFLFVSTHCTVHLFIIFIINIHYFNNV